MIFGDFRKNVFKFGEIFDYQLCNETLKFEWRIEIIKILRKESLRRDNFWGCHGILSNELTAKPPHEPCHKYWQVKLKNFST